LSKSCQKLSKKCQKYVKKLSKSCQIVVKKLSQKVVTIGPSNPKLEKPASSHLVKRRSDQEWRMKNEEGPMKKLGIRRLDATSSYLVIKRQRMAGESATGITVLD
jgi:hypothetical protein